MRVGRRRFNYKDSYAVANPRDSTTKLIPDDLLMRKSNGTKIVYESNSSDYRVLVDFRNGYFRVIDTTADDFPFRMPDGYKMPDETYGVRYNDLTHFRIEGWKW